jgi:hypothetical protein
VVDVTSNGKRVNVLSTNANADLKQNVVDVFGPKLVGHFLEFNIQ